MPDIQFFDAAGFFSQKVGEVEQVLIAKKAELEILNANRRNLESTIGSLALLAPDHQRAIQSELASLKEVLNSTERNLGALEGEIDLLSDKLAALRAAWSLLQVRKP
ncbi:MAG: hypothetical protein ACM3XM_02895 [Mycobacterium leprae]